MANTGKALEEGKQACWSRSGQRKPAEDAVQPGPEMKRNNARMQKGTGKEVTGVKCP